MLSFDPKNRFTVTQLLSEPIFDKIRNIELEIESDITINLEVDLDEAGKDTIENYREMILLTMDEIC